MRTNLTSRASRRHIRVTEQKEGLLSTRLRCLTSSHTTATNPKWTSWAAILHPCPSLLETFSALRHLTGTPPTARSILGQPWPDIQPLTPTWAHTTEDKHTNLITEERSLNVLEKQERTPTRTHLSWTLSEPRVIWRYGLFEQRHYDEFPTFLIRKRDKMWWMKVILYSSQDFHEYTDDALY